VTLSLADMRSELNQAMVGRAPGTERADALCATCVGLFDMDGAAVSVVLDGASSGTFGSSSETSRRMDEYQFTFGEGPCLDAVASHRSVLVQDLDAPQEQRWPVLRGALLEDGIRGVFAVPIMITSVCVGALDLFRSRPGPLEGVALAGALLAAELASMPLLDLMNQPRDLADREDAPDDPPHEADRVEVYQATGMLISALGVDADEALVRLRAHAMAADQTASQVARAIIERRLMLDRDDQGTTGDGGRSRR
jgi:hypothetical protein